MQACPAGFFGSFSGDLKRHAHHAQLAEQSDALQASILSCRECSAENSAEWIARRVTIVSGPIQVAGSRRAARPATPTDSTNGTDARVGVLPAMAEGLVVFLLRVYSVNMPRTRQ